MATHEERILRILSEATEVLFPSEIAERLNNEFRAGTAYTTAEVVACLQTLGKHVALLDDGRWMLKRLML